MHFTDHIEELRWHIVRSLIAVLVFAIVAFFNIEWIFDRILLGPAHADFISYRALCWMGHELKLEGLCLDDVKIKFQNTELAGQFTMSFSVSLMIGFITAFPYVFWEFWRFIKPALKEQELKHATGIVFWSSSLFLCGVLFAYFIIVPFTVNFFGNYQLSPSFENIITIGNYYDTINDLVLGMGLVFEIPIVVYFLSKIGILTPKLMRDQRRIAILIIFVLAAVITPPDWFSIWLVAIPLIMLYEGGILIAGRVVKSKNLRNTKYDNL
ncbi:MAG: twin-arginine translocase subunit TatC [Chitinophagaceae bacterium]|nr:twin-arginine translocase subunit TatC [Chitinophagaceae bacterium]